MTADIDPDDRSAWLPERFHLLACAAFHVEPDRARDAWATWQGDVDFDDLAWPEMRIFPFVARRLTELGISTAHAPRIHGIRQHLWVRSVAILRAATPVLGVLAAAAIPLLVFKGAERILSRRADTGPAERLIVDVDLLVPRPRIADAVSIIEACGWRNSRTEDPQELLQLLRSTSHSIGFGKGAFEIDLHGSALLLNRCRDHDDGLWQRARPINCDISGLSGPAPSDRLVIACGHGLVYDPQNTLDWIADAIAALDDEEFDWDVFVDEIERRDLAAHARAALRYLSVGLGHDVPVHVLSALSAAVSPALMEEFSGHKQRYEATSGSERRAWGRAAQTRAVKSMGRLRCADPDYVHIPPAAPAMPEWQRAVRQTEGHATFKIAVPPEVRDHSGIVTLEFEVVPNPLALQRSGSIALTCFDSHTVELDREIVPSGKRATWLPRRRKISFDVEGAMLAAYDLHDVRIEFLKEDTLEASGEVVNRLSFRWIVPA
jgi:hypothetical protein